MTIKPMPYDHIYSYYWSMWSKYPCAVFKSMYVDYYQLSTGDIDEINSLI